MRWIPFLPMFVLLAAGGAYAESAAAGLQAGEQLPQPLAELSSDTVFAVSKRLQLTQESPAIVHVLTRQDILRGGFRNLNEVLATIPEIELVDTGRRQLLLVRGVPFTLVALLDGVSLVNHGDNRVDLERLVPIEIVRKVEVVLSPGAVLWGAHSIFGVVNIITRGAEERGQQRIAVSGGWWDTLRAAQTLSSRWRRLRWQLHVDVETSRGKNVFVEDSILDDLLTNGNRGQTDNAAGLFMHVFGSAQAGGWYLRALAQLVDEHTYPINEISGAKGAQGVYRRPTVLLSTGYDKALAFKKLQLDLGILAYLFDQGYEDTAYELPPSERLPKGWWHGGTIDHQLRVGTTLEAKASYFLCNSILGVEGFRSSVSDFDHLSNFNGREVPRLALPSSSSATMSVYGQQELRPLPDLNLAAGVRWNLSSTYRSAVLFHGHLVYEPLDGLFIKGNYSEGFRPPSYEQRFLDFPQQKGSTELDPERARVIEAQSELYQAFSGRVRLRVGAGYSYASLEGLIGTLPLAPRVVRYFENMSGEKIHSLSAFSRFQIERGVDLGLFYVHHFPVAQEQPERRDFARDRLSFRATVLYLDPVHISLSYVFTGSREIADYEDLDTLEPRTLPLDAYHELTLAARYRLGRTGFYLSGKLSNLLFQDYDHAPPAAHLAEIYRGPFPQPHTMYGFLTVEYVRGL